MSFNYNDVEGGQSERLSADARANLQCNILFPTLSYRSKQLFVRFEKEMAFRSWLKDVPLPSSERMQYKTQPNAPSVNLLFTHAGLVKLGLRVQADELDPAFVRGSRVNATIRKLRDSDPSTWGPHSGGESWDAAMIVHSDSDQALAPPPGAAHVIEDGHSLGIDGEVVTAATAEKGRYNVLGYREGLSMTVYEGDWSEPNVYDPRRKLSTLLTKDPFSNGSDFGSHFVFRKYDIAVDDFDKRIAAIARSIEARTQTPGSKLPLEVRFPVFKGLSGEPLEEKLRAWIVGRGRDGKPLASSEQATKPEDNDFDFQSDQAGKACPFHSHIRKMNPRGNADDVRAERSRSIARRGNHFGSRSKRPAGMLFWCAQRSIERQFEYLIETGANSHNVDVLHTPNPDIDDLIGRPAPERFEEVTDKYPIGRSRYERWKETIDVKSDLWELITPCGAEYFFAPSISGFLQIAGRQS